MPNKTSLRNFIGELPLAAELDYALRQKNRDRKDHYTLSRLQKALPLAVEQVKPYIQHAQPGKKILFFATLHYWIEQAAFFSLALAGLGHKVTLLTLPYAEWPKFDPALLVESEIEIPVSVNGKMRDVIKVPVDADNATLEAAAKASAKVQEFLAGKTIKKVIIVPKKMVNIVAG